MRKKAVLWGIGWGTILLFFSIIMPGILVKPHFGYSKQETAKQSVSQTAFRENTISVPVYLSKQQRTEKIPLENYVRGVVAAEMPIEFEAEALKAQALAARTYIVRKMVERDFSDVPTQEAWVTDTVQHQAYYTIEQLQEKWGGDKFGENFAKLNRAVEETKGLILTYQGQPINATFFSTSNGYTENSEDYWRDYIPYLRSVTSPWDKKLSPRFSETVTISYREMLRKLGFNAGDSANIVGQPLTVLERTEGNRIKKARVGNKIFSGREIREKLNLHSSQFMMSRKGNDVEITTIGYGHGVGMSQWGANGMAKEGKNAEQIVKYYYSGIEITEIASVIKS